MGVNITIPINTTKALIIRATTPIGVNWMVLIEDIVNSDAKYYKSILPSRGMPTPDIVVIHFNFWKDKMYPGGFIEVESGKIKDEFYIDLDWVKERELNK